MIKLPSLSVDLPDWPTKDLDRIRVESNRVAKIGAKAGSGSDVFKIACQDIRKLSLTSNQSLILERIKTSTDVRALFSMMLTDDRISELVNLDKKLLGYLSKIRYPMSKLSLQYLIRLYFTKFDILSEFKDLEGVSNFIRISLAQMDILKGASTLGAYKEHAEVLFYSDGPSRFVSQVRKFNLDFDTLLAEYGLTGFADGRFPKLCRYTYYIETLNSIGIGDDHSVLTEVCKSDVYGAPYSDGKLLGHMVLETLIDRVTTQTISASWQSVILNIAGDPRVPKTNRRYQKWWAVLGEERMAKMRGWLSRLDLELFLRVLEQSAKDGKNEDMERMFKPRKAFMEGLLHEGVVVESRLILSSQAKYYVYQNYRKEDLPEFADIRSTQTSVIYLRLKNNIHMIEGSHSFSLKLMDKLPSGVHIQNYSAKMFSDGEIRKAIGSAYLGEFGNDGGFLEKRHDNLIWQNAAINYFYDRGLKVDVSQLLPKNMFRKYREKFGVRL